MTAVPLHAPAMVPLARRLAAFGALCLLLTWVPWAVLGIAGVDLERGVGALGFGLAASGPSLAALGMWLWRRERRPGPRTRWSPSWVIVSVVVAAAPGLVVSLLVHRGDLATIADHADGMLAEVGIPAAIAFTLLAGPVAEEFGWRGYAQPRLRERLGRTSTVAVLGLAWGAWHLPLYFLDGTGQAEAGLLTAEALTFFLALFPLSLLMLVVSEDLRGGVPAAILVHATWNLVDELLPPVGAAGQWLELGALVAFAAAVDRVRRRPAMR